MQVPGSLEHWRASVRSKLFKFVLYAAVVYCGSVVSVCVTRQAPPALYVRVDSGSSGRAPPCQRASVRRCPLRARELRRRINLPKSNAQTKPHRIQTPVLAETTPRKPLGLFNPIHNQTSTSTLWFEISSLSLKAERRPISDYPGSMGEARTPARLNQPYPVASPERFKWLSHWASARNLP